MQNVRNFCDGNSHTEFINRLASSLDGCYTICSHRIERYKLLMIPVIWNTRSFKSFTRRKWYANDGIVDMTSLTFYMFQHRLNSSWSQTLLDKSNLNLATILFTKYISGVLLNSDMLFAISSNLFFRIWFAKKSKRKTLFLLHKRFLCARFFKFPSKRKKRRYEKQFYNLGRMCATGSVKRKSAANDFKAF